MTMDLTRASKKESCLNQDNDIKTTCVQNVAHNHQTETPKSAYILKWRTPIKIGQMIPKNPHFSHSLQNQIL